MSGDGPLNSDQLVLESSRNDHDLQRAGGTRRDAMRHHESIVPLHRSNDQIGFKISRFQDTRPATGCKINIVHSVMHSLVYSP